MKTTIVLSDVYCDVTYPEYLHVRNRYYTKYSKFQMYTFDSFWEMDSD